MDDAIKQFEDISRDLYICAYLGQEDQLFSLREKLQQAREEALNAIRGQHYVEALPCKVVG